MTRPAAADCVCACGKASHAAFAAAPRGPRSGLAGKNPEGTVAPVMFGKPLLDNLLGFDHVQLQK